MRHIDSTKLTPVFPVDLGDNPRAAGREGRNRAADPCFTDPTTAILRMPDSALSLLAAAA
jgi:hypothetical protein